MSSHPTTRTDDIAACIRDYVAAAIRGAGTDATSFADHYFAYCDGEAARRLVAQVNEGLDALQDRAAAQALGICECDWAAYEAIFLSAEPC